MKRTPKKSKFPIWRKVFKYPTALTAALVTAVFSIRFIHVLPFSGHTRVFNLETVMSLVSVFTYNREPFSFPLGTIHGFTYPFHDANVGNVGSVALFALFFKILSRIIPAFRTFDYFVFLEMLSCFVTAYVSQKILAQLGVRRMGVLALGALFTGGSLLILNRSEWLQPFCMISFPLFIVWTYTMQVTLVAARWNAKRDLAILALFPAAALADNYTLVGILLGTGALLFIEGVAFAQSRRTGRAFEGKDRLIRLSVFCGGGILLSLFWLYLIGMAPLPKATGFTSQDFGMGGRVLVADLFGPWIPLSGWPPYISSLPGRLGFPVTTNLLNANQMEGLAYVGTATLLLWLGLLGARLFTKTRFGLPPHWKKIAFAATAVFAYSLGYQLHIFGVPFPRFTLMPAAVLSDRIHSLYNIRTPGRLALLFSFFLILEGLRRLNCWLDQPRKHKASVAFATIAVLLVIHFVEIVPALTPVPSQPIFPMGHAYSEQEISQLRELGATHKAVFIAPHPLASVPWGIQIYSAAYYLGIPNTIYFLARANASHTPKVEEDRRKVEAGEWEALNGEYGNVLFAIPIEKASALRSKVQRNYREVRVGTLSLWTRKSPFL